jgi:hypothetical protein
MIAKLNITHFFYIQYEALDNKLDNKYDKQAINKTY